MTAPGAAGPFRRQHHNSIFAALNELDGDMLLAAECYFGGGTAVALMLDEYRQSVDIDFLCASQAGYRKLRHELWGRPGLDGLLRAGAALETLRDVRADQYGIRTVIGVGDAAIRFEIIREARIPLAGAMDHRFGVPILARHCLYAEKLLANADRWNDRAVLSRDIIDLSMMVLRWGPVPEAAWALAEAAYGDAVRRAHDAAIMRIRDEGWLEHCLSGLAMEAGLGQEILGLHGGPLIPEP
ncbi:MAG: nucleotidyl transferase AbiEii/AbiGii toxin family protein [Rubellimicrobium sp.]|nr:nucleotidyl transferase AbiEii/AbiGii toxin family protein [Rubellimicrobium sp.]